MDVPTDDSDRLVRRALVVMAKYPAAGRSKTRLVPPMRNDEAAEFARGMVLDALDQACGAAAADPTITPVVAIWPTEYADRFASLAPDIDQVGQTGETLDERLDHVLVECERRGFQQIVAMNSDSPTLPAERLRAAFGALGEPSVDVVLGPADDGGYYLIGWRRHQPGIVRGVTMSTPHVLADTLDRAAAGGLTVALLDRWYDVDEPADLDRLCRELSTSTAPATNTRRFLGRWER